MAGNGLLHRVSEAPHLVRRHGYEWRSGPRSDQGGFWVILWSKDPKRLWWELRDEFDRQTLLFATPIRPSPAQSAFKYR